MTTPQLPPCAADAATMAQWDEDNLLLLLGLSVLLRGNPADVQRVIEEAR